MKGTLRRTAAEALGTALLVLLGAGAILADALGGGHLGSVGIALAFGFVVLVVVYAIGHLSGAHINPAVTVAFWSVGRFPARDVIPYVAGQALGAIGGAALLGWMLSTGLQPAVTMPSIPLPQALAIEFVLAFSLMFVITAVATDDRVAAGAAGLSIGLTVALGALVAGGLTGASMNPARSLGPALVAGVWSVHWLYWLGPLAGAVAGARAYDALRPASVASTMRKRSPTGVLGPLPVERIAGTPRARGQGA